MQVDILNPNKSFNIEAGDLIVTRIKSVGSINNYLVVKEHDRGISAYYKLLNVGTSTIVAVSGYKDSQDIIGFIEETLKAEVLDVIPANKLKLGLK